MPARFDLSCLKVMGDSTQRRKRVFGILTDDPFSLKPFLHFLGKTEAASVGSPACQWRFLIPPVAPRTPPVPPRMARRVSPISSTVTLKCLA